MTGRQKEDAQLKKLKTTVPKVKESRDISKMIDDTVRKHHKVWLMTDLHLWIRNEKNKPACHKRSDFNTVINAIIKTVKSEDILIILGDLVDGEFREKDRLKDAISKLPGVKILVKGNNDLFDKAFYESCGFEDIVDSFVWKNILFTHIPAKNHKNVLNIHGHIHNSKTYWVPYNKMIDVAYVDGRKKPVLMQQVIKAQPGYSKLIKECPEHFNEGYNIRLDTFNIVMENHMNDSYIPDPFND